MARKKEKKKSDSKWDAEDADEKEAADKLLGTDMDEGHVEYDSDRTVTYDSETGLAEGEVVLKDGNEEGLLAFVKIIEEVNVKQDHEAVVESITFSGRLDIENPSTVDRLWDIDITLANIESTSLDSSEIHIQELGVTEDDNVDSREFEISGEAKNLLLVKEYINTLPNADDILNISDIETDLMSEPSDEDVDEDVDEDEETDGGVAAEDFTMESYGISIDKENTVTFAIAIRSMFDKPITDVKITKNIPGDFTNTMINDTTVGMAELEGDQIIWTIDELEPETTALLKFTSDIMVTTIDPVPTGTIEVSYIGTSSFAEGLSVEKFDAYTRNRFYVDILERDEEPGVWDCNLVFENSSEFILELFNADVYAPDDESTKLIDIDPNEVPKLPSGAQWHSVGWAYESDDYPSFRKKLEFRVVPDFQTLVNGTIAISDVELSIASITGEVKYSLAEIEAGAEIEEAGEEEEEEAVVILIPTFKEKDVFASVKLVNNGSAALNDLTIRQQFFSEEFVAPTADEIKLVLDGAEIELSEEAVSTEENVLTITLSDLRSSDTGEIQPEAMLELIYPIHCINPARESRFESEMVYLANTYPLSQELEFTPEVPVIEATHIRRKFRIGKEVIPIGALGQYQIILSVENLGESPLQNLILLDLVPDSFEYTNMSQEPEITDEVGQDTLKWTIESLEEGDKVEYSYEITGTGEYSPSDAQLAF